MSNWRLVVLGLIWMTCQSCGVYSFTGASISPDTKTLSVPNFLDRSTASPPYLAQTFSEKTREYYQRNTNLILVNKEGDLHVEGTISQYNITPVAPVGSGTGVERAAQTRLTIGVQVKFTNSKNKEQNFDQSFSFYQDFDQSKTLTSVERDLIETISDQIILDIFNKTVANW
jgi:hypothetical protein